MHYFPKEERSCVAVLINHHVVDDVADCANLVVSQGIIDSRPVEILILVIRFGELVLIEHWVLT